MAPTMKAVQWTSPYSGLDKDLKVFNDVEQLDKDDVAPGWTMVKVAYSTLNPVDFKIPELPIGSFLPTRIPCMDYSGIVVRANRADGLKPGQRVFGKTEPPKFGALAEYLFAGKQGCVPLPDGVSLEDAATIGVTGLTAYQVIVPKLKSGGKVLINGGSGGVGVYAIQIAKIHGLHVTATCTGANVELCKTLGADEVIDYRSVDLVKHLTRSGRQYDAVIDLVFADANLYWQSHNYLKADAPYITIVGVPTFEWFRTMLSIYLWPSWYGGGQRKFVFHMCATNAEHYAQIAQWMAEGKIKAVIDKRLEMDEIKEGFARLKTSRTRGKLTVRIGGENVAL